MEWPSNSIYNLLSKSSAFSSGSPIPYHIPHHTHKHTYIYTYTHTNTRKHKLSCHVTSCRSVSHHTMPCHVTPHHATVCHTACVSHRVAPCHVMPFHAMSCHTNRRSVKRCCRLIVLFTTTTISFSPLSSMYQRVGILQALISLTRKQDQNCSPLHKMITG